MNILKIPPGTRDLWVSTALTILETPPFDLEARSAVVQQVTYYRLTPGYWGWICRAMQRAGQVVAAGANDARVSPTEYAEATERFEEIRQWVVQRYTPEEIRRGQLVIWCLEKGQDSPVEAASGRDPAVTSPQAQNATAGQPEALETKPTHPPRNIQEYLEVCSQEDWEAVTDAIAERAWREDPFADVDLSGACANPPGGDVASGLPGTGGRGAGSVSSVLRESGLLKVEGKWLAVSARDWFTTWREIAELKGEDRRRAARLAMQKRMNKE